MTRHEGLEEFFHAHGPRRVIVVMRDGTEVELSSDQDGMPAVDAAVALAEIDRLPEITERVMA